MSTIPFPALYRLLFALARSHPGIQGNQGDKPYATGVQSRELINTAIYASSHVNAFLFEGNFELLLVTWLRFVGCTFLGLPGNAGTSST